MSSLTHPVDIYCERLDPHLWAEPLNAVSNLAFLLAAYLLAKQVQRVGIKSRPIYCLITLIALIGIGSGLFHTFANRLTMWMDMIPITLFLLSYIWIFARQVSQQTQLASTLWLVAFLILGVLVGYAPESLAFNGTIGYLPALIYLLGMSYIVKRKQMLRAANYLSLASIIFMFSMIMRSMDMMVCDSIVSGTHFIWHLCNGLVLYLVTMALINAKRVDNIHHA